MTSSTPDALWGAPPLRVLRPAAVAWRDVRYRTLLAGCTLSVPVGARLLVVGEPPASASALVRVLAGLSPARGRIEIAGLRSAGADGWGRRVAFLGPEPGVRGWMTPRETLRLAADLLGLPLGAADRRIGEVVEWTRIPSAALDRPVRRGGRALAQRTGLASALLADPEVLLLDEPLRALDVDERRRLLRVPGARRTLIMASRQPDTEYGIVSHVALLRAGRVADVIAVRALVDAGLPLSMSGILAHADRAASTAAAAGGGPQRAVAAR